MAAESAVGYGESFGLKEGFAVKFGRSAETYHTISNALLEVGHIVDACMNEALEASDLRGSGSEVYDISIVMNEDRREAFLKRHSRERGEPTFYLCPQLDAAPFVHGSPEARIAEYLRGLSASLPRLAAMGVPADQVEAFRAAVEATREALLGPPQTRIGITT